MIHPHDFARRQMELTAEFARYVVDHPEVDDRLPEQSYIYFEIAGEAEFNRTAANWPSGNCARKGCRLFACGSRAWRRRRARG
ncbi:MAG: hypothetical protein KY476_15185 [Planctomycetes bacterium]|nr:hypothetical protein [Planctomycetota bacterium]